MDHDQSSNQVSIGPDLTLASSSLRFRFSHSSGPGGQHVNKVATRATLSVALADLSPLLPPWAMRRLLAKANLDRSGEHLVIHSSATRSQQANRKDCLAKLRQLVIAALHRPRYRKPTRPTAGSIQRRLDSKKRRSQIKQRRQDQDFDD
jgi:ribosome-associated protein